MAWGPGYGAVPPPNPAAGHRAGGGGGRDPFAAAERDTKAMVAAGWWSTATAAQRAHAVAGQALALPDGTWWLFGAWARWYRWHPSDQQWHLCPPPQSAATRHSARPVRQGSRMPEPPPHLVPAGPDFDCDLPKALPFVGKDLGRELTTRVSSTLEAAAALPSHDYPHWWEAFSPSVPSTVALAWGVMLWCASAPVFDSRYDEELLALWNPYRVRRLPVVDGPRWLTPPPLEALIALYAERLRAGRTDAATVVLRTMWAVAGTLRADLRFRARADALVAVVGTTLGNPQADYGSLSYGDQVLVQQWVSRVPAGLAPAMRTESSPGDNFRHAYYDLATSLARVCGDPADPSYIEPRLVAAALLAAELAVVKQPMVETVLPWLDPEIRYTVQAVLSQAGHPLRRLWPADDRLSDALRVNLRGRSAALLAAMYGADLAWCRLVGIPARPRGFPVATAIISELVGPERARNAVSAAPITAPPGIGTPAGPPAGFHGAGSGQAAGSGQGADPGPGAGPGQGTGRGEGGLKALDLPGGLPPADLPPQRWGAVPAEVQGSTEEAEAEHRAVPLHGVQPEIQAQPQVGEADWVPPYTMLGFEPHQGSAAPVIKPDFSAQPFGQDEADDPYQPPPFGPPPEDIEWMPQYTVLGFERGKGLVPDQPEETARDWAPPSADLNPQATRPDDARLATPPVGSAPGPAPGQGAGPGGPPRTKVLGAEEAAQAAAGMRSPAAMPGTDPASPSQPGRAPGAPVPPRPATAANEPGTRIMSETMVGGFLDVAAQELRRPPVVPPPSGPANPVIDRHGVRLVAGTGPESDVAALLEEVCRDVGWAGAAMPPAASTGSGAPSVLLVGEAHSGQRRLARMIALGLAEAGAGDGSVRIADADDVRGAPPQGLRAVFDPGTGPVLLFERLDAVINESADPATAAGAIQAVRADRARTPLIASCDPRAYRRLTADFPGLTAALRVLRLPDLSDSAARLTLLNVLAAERRVTVDVAAFATVQRDLARLHGPGELTNARLVEGYLDRAAQRHLGRLGAGAAAELVLTVEDFAGIAEEIEPTRRVAGDVDGLLRRLDQMVGIAQIKEAVHRLAAAALAGGGERGGQQVEGGPRHLVLLGRPGAGKSTVAGLVGGIYAALGMLDSGHLVPCRPVHLAGSDAVDTENRVYGMVEQAMGGVLLIHEAHRLEQLPDVVAELRRYMDDRRGRFIVVCTSAGKGFEAYLLNNPEFREYFGEIVRFIDLTDRELVQLFQQQAERELYTLDEELRAELMVRFARMRDDEAFAFGRTVREMFEQTVARQAARLAGANAPAVAVTRLSARDLPESMLEQAFRDFHRQGRG